MTGCVAERWGGCRARLRRLLAVEIAEHRRVPTTREVTARLVAVVLLPTPPLELAIRMMGIAAV